MLLDPTPLETSEHSVDLVAIHGLGGDLRDTWTHKNGTLWLRDLLPKSMPGARVYTYGYPSKVFLNRSVAGIREFSTYLLDALNLEMRDSVSSTCSSLGLKVLILTRRKAPTLDRLSMCVTVLGGSFSSRWALSLLRKGSSNPFRR